MAIHQVLHVAAWGDAVTSAALGYRNLLRQVGPSEMFARHIDPHLADEVRPLGRYGVEEHLSPADIILYHVATGSPDVVSFLLRRRERIGIVYHNITPSEFFEPYDVAFAEELSEGRQQLEALRARVSFAFADSHFNARELEALGYQDVRVVPPAVEVDALTTTPPDPATTRFLDTEMEGPLLLFVGQLLPHKRPELLLAAHHVLTTYLVPEARLALVGPSRPGRYRQILQRFAQELNLTGVWFRGWVRPEELAALYRRADLFVTASEHEGFCVPLLEAMAFGVPTLARAFAAIPETVGDAGIVLPPDDDPVLFAEVAASALGDAGMRARLVEAGTQRLDTHGPVAARTVFLENLLAVI